MMFDRIHFGFCKPWFRYNIYNPLILTNLSSIGAIFLKSLKSYNNL
jgi:hypothetical protein